MVDPITGVLRVIGNDPSPQPNDEDLPLPPGRRKNHMYSTKVADLLGVLAAMPEKWSIMDLF
jgi:hypothetical protein